MADTDAARRREIRRRKILEGSEARLKRITNTASSKTIEEIDLINSDKKETLTESDVTCTVGGLFKSANNDQNEHTFSTGLDDNYLIQRKWNLAPENSNKSNGILSEDDIYLSNGARSNALENYTFPKKLSDAETRSFSKTRCDVRRNSTCTQIMMETLQFSSFSLNILRPWLTILIALMLKWYFLLTRSLPAFETIYFPFLMLELTFSMWSLLESQMFTKPTEGPLISGILLLWGVSENVISKFNTVWNILNYITIDFAIYTFFFVFFHFICELCL